MEEGELRAERRVGDEEELGVCAEEAGWAMATAMAIVAWGLWRSEDTRYPPCL